MRERRACRISIRTMRRENATVRRLPVLHDYERPKTRAECPVERPCPFVSCKHHLYLDVAPSGSLIMNHPAIEPDELVESCALDVAEQGGVTLEYISRLLNLARERVRQIEETALNRLRRRLGRLVTDE